MTVKLHAYALNLEVGNATAKLILAGLAEHAHEDGTAAFPSKNLLARYGECSLSSVKRHLRYLQERGFIRHGDQRHVQHYRADRRPVVYNVATDTSTQQQWATEYAAQGKRGSIVVAPRARGSNVNPREGDAGQTGGQSEPPIPTGVQESAYRGSTAVTPKPSTKPKEPPPCVRAPAREANPTVEEEAASPNLKNADAFVAELPGPMSHTQIRHLAATTASLLSSGWTTEALRRELTVDLGTARSRYAVYRHRLDQLADAPPPPPVPTVANHRPQHVFVPGHDGIACIACGTPERNAAHAPKLANPGPTPELAPFVPQEPPGVAELPIPATTRSHS